MLNSVLLSLLPARSNTSQRQRLRASVGALLGLLITSFAAHYLLGDNAMWLVAPVGASSVLLFCLPASPMAQPWAVIGGNVVSGLMGVACVQFFGPGPLAAALATPLAIAAMYALRCLHPPGGATALMMVIGGPAVHAMGYRLPLGPVLVDCVLVVLAAIVYNNLTGRRYPHSQQLAHPNPHATKDEVPTVRFGFQPEDLDAVLRQYNQELDISRDDLEELFLKTEMRAYQRRFGIITCGDIMSKDVVTAEFATPLADAWREMRRHRIAAVPVLNRVRRVIGIVTTSDFMAHGGLDDYHGMRRQLLDFLRPSGTTHSEKPEVVGQIMVKHPRTASIDTPITELVPLMADSGFHHIPVLDHEDRFAGIVTQSDVVAALYARNALSASEGQTPSSCQAA
ncbi:HPP family protein [Pseudoduganella sp. R-31]|uniref:HPP family protein n=1 Tax=unclassified Pseudoduganella TaxID=2637179 RepID=UPI003CED8F44